MYVGIKMFEFFADVAILTAYHPGDNVMVLMTVMTCQMRQVVQAV